jgi:O-acetyl-ADP-ribose deacetylase (regulator of RNase III)
MGRGVALQAALKYPELAKELGERLSKYGNQVYAFYYENVFIITVPTKDHWRDSSNYKLVNTSLLRLVEIVERLQIKNVVLPLIATGCGGLNKEHIKELLNDVLDDTYTLCIQ